MVKFSIFITLTAALSVTSTLARSAEQFPREPFADDAVDLAGRGPLGRSLAKSVARGAGEGLGSGLLNRVQTRRELAAEDEVDELAAREPIFGPLKFFTKTLFGRAESAGVGNGSPSRNSNQRRELAADDELEMFSRELDEYLQERDLEDIDLD